MRAFLFLFPALVMAQTPPAAPKAAPPPAKAAKSATAAKSPTAAKSAKAKAPAAAGAASGAAAGLTTDDQRIVYAVGLSMAQQLSQLDLSPAELEILKKALSDAAAGKPALELNTWGPKINTFAQGRVSRASVAEKAKAKVYLDAAATEPGMSRAPSGLLYRELKAGTGASPKATDQVLVNYRGTLTNGTEFDNSYKRNTPLPIGLNQVIPCWTEGVQKMKVGGKAKLVCPSDIAYGDGGRPGIPGGATLIFEIDLLAINPPPPAAAK